MGLCTCPRTTLRCCLTTTRLDRGRLISRKRGSPRGGIGAGEPGLRAARGGGAGVHVPRRRRQAVGVDVSGMERCGAGSAAKVVPSGCEGDSPGGQATSRPTTSAVAIRTNATARATRTGSAKTTFFRPMDLSEMPPFVSGRVPVRCPPSSGQRVKTVDMIKEITIIGLRIECQAVDGLGNPGLRSPGPTLGC